MKSALRPCCAVLLVAVVALSIAVPHCDAAEVDILQREGATKDTMLSVGQASFSPARSVVGQCVEVSVAVRGQYANPFDPGQIAVTAVLERGSERRELTGFFCEQAGDQSFRVRFTPTAAGTHRLRLRAHRGAQEADAGSLEIAVGPSAFAGFVRIAADRPRLEHDDGTPCVPLGINLFYLAPLGRPLPVERLPWCLATLEKLRAHGGNFIRLRMDSWWFGIENPDDPVSGFRGLGYYHQGVCGEIDRILRWCEQHGVKVLLCLDNANASVNGVTNKEKKSNPYLADVGGPCRTPDEFWTNGTCRKAVRQRLRYVVARWGYSPAILGWELWNELELRRELLPQQNAWCKEMAAYLRQLDPHRRLVTNSTGVSTPLDEARAREHWTSTGLQLVQEHHYGSPDSGIIFQQRASVTRRLYYNQPFLVGEFGPDGDGRLLADDAAGLDLHNGLWGSLLSGSYCAAVPWFVRDYVDRYQLWSHFRPLADFARDVPWGHPQLAPLSLPRPYCRKAAGSQRHDLCILPAKTAFARPQTNEFVVGRDGTITDGAEVPKLLFTPLAHPDLRNPPTFFVAADVAWTFSVQVGNSVGDERNTLRIDLDGREVLREPLPAGRDRGKESTYLERSGNWRTRYDKSCSIAVPAGKHIIRLDAEGKDRVEMEGIRFHDYAASQYVPATAIGLGTDESAFVWIHHLDHCLAKRRLGVEPSVLSGLSLDIAPLQAGQYRVEWLDTLTGQTFHTASCASVEGRLTLDCPPLRGDYALRVIRQQLHQRERR